MLCSVCLIAGLALAQPVLSRRAPDRLLVVNAEGTLAILDAASGATVGSVRVGTGPREVAVSPDGSLAVVSNHGFAQGGQTISIVDVRAARVVRSVETRYERKHLDGSVEKARFHRPAALAFLPGGAEFVAAVETEGRLLFIDVASGTVLDAVELGQEGARGVLIGPDRRRVFVSNPTSGSISVVDIARRRVEATVEAGGGAGGMALHPTRAELWVANATTDSISVIDLERLQETIEFACGEEPVDLAFNSDGTRLVCANRRAGTLSIFATDARKAIEEVVLAGKAERGTLAPTRLIAPDGANVYVSCSGDRSVRVVDTVSWKVTGRLDAGEGPYGLAWIGAAGTGTDAALLAK